MLLGFVWSIVIAHACMCGFLCRRNFFRGTKWRMFSPLMLFSYNPAIVVPDHLQRSSTTLIFRLFSGVHGALGKIQRLHHKLRCHCERSSLVWSSITSKWLSSCCMLWSLYVIFSFLIVSLVNFRSLEVSVVGAMGVTVVHSAAIFLVYRCLNLHLLLCISCFVMEEIEVHCSVWSLQMTCCWCCFLHFIYLLLVQGGHQCRWQTPSEVAHCDCLLSPSELEKWFSLAKYVPR